MKKFIAFKKYGSDGMDIVVAVDKILCMVDSGGSDDECEIKLEDPTDHLIFKIDQVTYDRIKQELMDIEEEEITMKKIRSAISELEV